MGKRMENPEVTKWLSERKAVPCKGWQNEFNALVEDIMDHPLAYAVWAKYQRVMFWINRPDILVKKMRINVDKCLSYIEAGNAEKAIGAFAAAYTIMNQGFGLHIPRDYNDGMGTRMVMACEESSRLGLKLKAILAKVVPPMHEIISGLDFKPRREPLAPLRG